MTSAVMQFFLLDEFSQLNDYIRLERTSKFEAARVKRVETARVQMDAQSMLLHRQVKKYPVRITFDWYRKDQRTDPDNIAFAQKFILDGLVAAGVLRGDGWKEIYSIEHHFMLASDCDTRPGVKISIRPAQRVVKRKYEPTQITL